MLKLRFEMNTAKHLNRKQKKKCNNKNDKKQKKQTFYHIILNTYC